MVLGQPGLQMKAAGLHLIVQAATPGHPVASRVFANISTAQSAAHMVMTGRERQSLLDTLGGMSISGVTPAARQQERSPHNSRFSDVGV